MGTFGTRQIKIFLMAMIILSGLLVLIVVESPAAVKWQNQLEQVHQSEELTFIQSPCGCLRNSTAIKTKSFEWCSSESTYRGFSQKIVAFSLFRPADDRGKQYLNLLKDNAISIDQLLPGWIMRLYHNLETNSPEHRLLCDVYCTSPWLDLCDINALRRKLSKRKRKNSDFRPVNGEQISNLNRRIWRYLPLLDSQVDIALMRDLDALITKREIDALNQWLESNYTFHVMRDHQVHKAFILAGLFGVKVQQRRDLVEGLTRALISFGQNQRYATDQILLSKIFWPSVKHDVMAHDSYNCMEYWNALPTYPFPSQRVNSSFVSNHAEGHWIAPKKCPVACRPLDHQDWEYC